jgi:prepilin-type N-terminal cleavage/methylation domain-containing protein
MLKLKKQSGFTLVELLVVVVIIGILAAIALPNFIGAQQKAKTASVKGNMRTVQIASESYATDTGGVYCASGTGTIVNYLPGGTNTLGGSTGNLPVNPCTNAATAVAAASVTNVPTQRSTAPGTFGTGNVGYSQVTVSVTGDSYAIIGGDARGQTIGGGGPGTTLVLSNQ